MIEGHFEFARLLACLSLAAAQVIADTVEADLVTDTGHHCDQDKNRPNRCDGQIGHIIASVTLEDVVLGKADRHEQGKPFRHPVGDESVDPFDGASAPIVSGWTAFERIADHGGYDLASDHLFHKTTRGKDHPVEAAQQRGALRSEIDRPENPVDRVEIERGHDGAGKAAVWTAQPA